MSELNELSDLAIVFELIKRLGLKQTSGFYTNRDEYTLYRCSDINGSPDINGDVVVSLGEGSGYGGFQVAFTFNDDGKIIKYGVWE